MLARLKAEGVTGIQKQIAIAGMGPHLRRPDPPAHNAQYTGHFGLEAGGLAWKKLSAVRRIQNIGHSGTPEKQDELESSWVHVPASNENGLSY
jgi:hypothetical protein